MKKKVLVLSPDSQGDLSVVFDAQGNPLGEVREFTNSEISRLQVVPDLLQMALGYKNQNMVRDVLFSEIPVNKENGKMPVLGREGQTQQNTDRALRGKKNHMDFGTGSLEFLLAESSLGFMIDDREEEAWAIDRTGLMGIRQMAVNQVIDIKQELQAAILATTAGNYPAAVSGASYAWATSGDPVKNILAQREVLRKQIGAYPNKCVFDPTAWVKFRTNEAVRSYASKFVVGGGKAAATIITEELAASILEVDEVAVGKGIYLSAGTGAPGTSNTATDIWSTVQAGNVVLAYTGAGMLEPSYGFKFKHKLYPKAVTYRVESNNSDVYETSHLYQFKHALVDSNGDVLAGQLIYSIV